jgi:MFS family permease
VGPGVEADVRLHTSDTSHTDGSWLNLYHGEAARMTFFRDLAALLKFSGFRWLFAVRLLSQASDGIFQVALASTVLFSPERAPTAGAIAAAFATILLPFTVFGPFVGVLLDRWSRRRILMASNASRAVLLLLIALLVVRDDVGWLFYLLVLTAFSVNRFLLAGLSASLPHVVSRDLLVTANAISPTSGSLAYLCGLAFGGAVHAVSHSDGIVLLVGAMSYFLSANLALRLPNLGPDLKGIDSEVREALGNVVRGLVDAARHLPPLGRLALGVVSVGQLPYAVMIVGTILLFGNHFEPADVGAGLAGFGVVVGASGAGYAVAALVTPSMTKSFGMHRYVTALSILAALMMVFPAALFTPWAIVVSAFGLGITTQGVKICADTTLQRVVADIYRGRVFALYDVLFNAVFIAATALAAIVLPTDGASYVVLATASLWYLLIALTVSKRWPRTLP